MAINSDKAVKISQKHLLGIQDLSVSDINFILSEAKQFINFGGWTLLEKTLNRIKRKMFDFRNSLH